MHATYGLHRSHTTYFLDAAALAGATAVVGDGRVVLDSRNADTGGDHARHRGFAAGAEALHVDLDLGDPDLAGLLTGGLAGAGGREGHALASALETDGSGRVPAEVLP